jgi:subtilase family serine protease
MLTPGPADAQFAERGGEVIIPESSTELPEHIGVKAHTNFRYFVPKAGRASEQFLHEVAPEQTGGPPFAGYFYETPASLACVYNLVSQQPGCNPNTVTANPVGGARAIAIVDAYHYPTAASDLSVFSHQFGLPQPNFQVVYASGRRPPVNASWNIEEALDIEWTHAMAPSAKIYLVEAASSSYSALLTAVSIASQLVAAEGGGEVSMSWGGSEFSSETSYDSYFTKVGVVYFAAAGDNPGVSWPSTSPNVVSVGGTTFSRNSSGAFQVEVTWQSGGGGPSVYEAGPPSYQSGISTIIGTRGTPDVAADANPSTGVWVYASPYWYIVGGTSVATPVWAGIVNSAGSFSSSSQTELTSMYKTLGTPAYAADFNDITTSTCGPNQGYLAGPVWDFCTGLGSPLAESSK